MDLKKGSQREIRKAHVLQVLFCFILFYPVFHWDNPTLLCQENNLIGKYSNWLGTVPMRFEPHDSKQDWEHQERMRTKIVKPAHHEMPKRLRAPDHGMKTKEDNFMSINPAETDHKQW